VYLLVRTSSMYIRMGVECARNLQECFAPYLVLLTDGGPGSSPLTKSSFQSLKLRFAGTSQVTTVAIEMTSIQMYSQEFWHHLCERKDSGIVMTYFVVGFFDFDFCCIFGDAKDLLPSQNIVHLSMCLIDHMG